MKVNCACCGDVIKPDDEAIRIGDLVSTDENYIHDRAVCAQGWLEGQCDTNTLDQLQEEEA